MASEFIPDPSFSTTLPKKKALLIAVMGVCSKAGSKFDGLPELAFAHRDAIQLPSYDYKDDGIILMLDDQEHPRHLWPTRRNILHQIDLFTKDATEGCHYFFYYAGHGFEEEISDRDREGKRADGLDDEIVCANGRPILDYELHDRLIKPLQKVKGSKLFTLFDCCHSENLLDLQRGSQPNTYSRAWPMGAGQRFKDLVIFIINLLRSVKHDPKRPGAPTPVRRSSTGLCSLPTSRTQEIGELSVICLSACRDRQFAHDDNERKLTFTKCFVNVVSSKPKITWADLRDELKELVLEIRANYEEACVQDSILSGSSETEESRKHWMQDPRYVTSCHVDLTQVVFF